MSAEADSGSGRGFPGLTSRAFLCRRFAAEMGEGGSKDR